MSLISRYILRSHIGPFLFGTLTVIFINLFQFILKFIDQLVGKGLSYWVIIQLIVLNTVWMTVLAVPIGVLFSTLMAFGGLSASHEVTIVKSSGGSLWKMMFPVIVAGFLLSLALYWFNDAVLPETNHRAKVLMNDINRKKPTFAIEAGKFSTEIEGYTILSRSVDSVKGTLYGVTIYDNTRGNGLNIVNADTGVAQFTADFSKLLLNLTNGEIHQIINNNVKTYRKILFKKYQIVMDAQGFTFSRTDEKSISRGDREMRIHDMQKIVDDAEAQSKRINNKISAEYQKHYNYLTGKNPEIYRYRSEKAEPEDTSRKTALLNAEKRINFLSTTISSEMAQKRDYDLRAEQYIVEIQKKYAIPFACLVFVFVGCPLGIITRGGNFGFSAAITLGFYIFYWACLIGGEKLADRGLMSPVLSMWLGNILIGVFGMILTFKVNNETIIFPASRFLRKIFKSNIFGKIRINR